MWHWLRSLTWMHPARAWTGLGLTVDTLMCLHVASFSPYGVSSCRSSPHGLASRNMVVPAQLHLHGSWLSRVRKWKLPALRLGSELAWSPPSPQHILLVKAVTGQPRLKGDGGIDFGSQWESGMPTQVANNWWQASLETSYQVVNWRLGPHFNAETSRSYVGLQGSISKKLGLRSQRGIERKSV